MIIKESDVFIKQTLKLSKKYPNIYKDIDNLKKEFSAIAFREIPPLNKRLLEVPIPNNFKKMVWRIRLINSNNNKGKSGGYRIFYTNINDNKDTIFLGIFSRPDIREGEYNPIAIELVCSIKEWTV